MSASIESSSHSSSQAPPPSDTVLEDDKHITEDEIPAPLQPIPGDDPFRVRFDPGDPNHPKNWSKSYKWYLTVVGGVMSLNTTFASSAPSGIIVPVMDRFHMSNEVAILTISLFVAGYCFGPLLWGPLSETYGRKPVFLYPCIIYTAFQVGNALAPNTASFLIFRFLGGFFAAAPLTNSGALLSDIWDPRTRGKAVSIFAIAPFVGPTTAPLVSGFIAVSGVPWNWVFWLLAIFAGICLVIIAFTVRETYEPRLLVLMAQKKRKETGDNRYYAPLETQKVSLSQRLQNIVTKPFKILLSEPMLIAITLYMSFIFGCLYLLFDAYPIVFGEVYGLNAGLTGLTYLPIAIGGILAILLNVLFWNPRYERLVDKFAPEPVPPEYRLEMAIWAAIPYAMAFFWFGWTSFRHVSLWAPVSQGIIMGCAIISLFNPLINYIIDTYVYAAASALAANTIIRSIFATMFPLFASQMYHKLNPHWASTLLGCFALLLAPIPLVLIKYGPALRAKSKFAHKRPTPASMSSEKVDGSPA